MTFSSARNTEESSATNETITASSIDCFMRVPLQNKEEVALREIVRVAAKSF
jgi:hypothetical protein